MGDDGAAEVDAEVDIQAMSSPLGTEPTLRAVPLADGRAPLVLVLGATGYIGGRLVPRLLAGGYRVRALTRSGRRLAALPWADQVEVIEGDASDADAMSRAMADVDIVYYLVHSMISGRDYGRLDRAIALTVAKAAAAHGVDRIVYLSGLHPDGVELSAHLASRQEVGDILIASATPTIVLQAGVVIGSGSASFEMIRHLTEVLPYMPAPRWVRNTIQPIAVRDVLYYLLAAARVEGEVNDAFDIGGPDVMRYSEMMNGYAEVAGLPRRGITALPVLTPGLASHWVGLVTPVPRQIARPLVESLLHSCVMKDDAIDGLIPPPPEGLMGYRDAVRFALGRIEIDAVETSWVDSRVIGAPSDPMPSDPDWAGRTVFQDARSKATSAPPDAVWDVITQVGGATGWYSASVLWATRGLIDRIAGGVGSKRGRRRYDRLTEGDAIDVWRVEHVEPGRLLRLRAEMRVPGKAWLELGVEPAEDGSEYRQRAVFFPRGLTGRLYWLSMLPFHGLVFSGMVNRIVAEAEGGSTGGPGE
ncbi:SDR family oxidoreductase [Demequina lignilytica]|uniref:SDR family oxidoreductase n=1 Tax=Demequina lignilytica TaxID=3051663 RepID=A0AB35MDW1_9MICO|nr:SDR family oxidoreductase [Demequina sp. SYSU T0a273]MDN4481938.1 SDR family oxidoreductase [Demequina sp. SYSU T0a273]